MRIGFFFNHDQVHQVAHSLPIAIALAQSRGAEVVVATTNDRLSAEVRRLSAEVGVRLPTIQLGFRRASSKLFASKLDKLFPAAKLAIYRDNLDFFRSLDALVVAEKTSSILKTHYGLTGLKIIHTRHGAGDRAIGFNKASALFDHILVSGPKIRTRLIEEAGVSPANLSIVGYPKFDLLPERPRTLPFQENGRPTVLYNPHVSPHLSSWYKQGRAVLDYFRDSTRYNLIFAPHVMLFHRPFALTIDKLRVDKPGKLCPSYEAAPNIHIDLGSHACTDMTYTSAADIYLGDVSSQVYEFLQRQRPCLFLNSHGVPYAGDANYAHWETGPVIENVADLDDALDVAVASHVNYQPAQKRLFDASFDLTDEPSAVRAARAILSVAAGGPVPLFPQRGLPGRRIAAAA